MRTSARNQFQGRITAIHSKTYSDDIEVTLPGGTRLLAAIPGESTQELGLQVGSTVIALIKAPWVIVVTGEEGVRFSARNRLGGVVRCLRPGTVNTEVVLALDGGGFLTAMVTRESAESMALWEGQRAWALFKASSVILGAPSAA